MLIKEGRKFPVLGSAPEGQGQDTYFGVYFIRQRVGPQLMVPKQVWTGLWKLVVLECGKKMTEAWGMAEGKSMVEE